jgi:hypothetical protein
MGNIRLLRFEASQLKGLSNTMSMTNLVKFVGLLLLFLLSFVGMAPSEAATCRQLNDRQICILTIKRSAKNYWEYRASVSIDGVVTPIEIYNCRDRIKTRKSGSIIRFEPNGAGELICSTLSKRNPSTYQ